MITHNSGIYELSVCPIDFAPANFSICYSSFQPRCLRALAFPLKQLLQGFLEVLYTRRLLALAGFDNMSFFSQMGCLHLQPSLSQENKLYDSSTIFVTQACSCSSSVKPPTFKYLIIPSLSIKIVVGIYPVA